MKLFYRHDGQLLLVTSLFDVDGDETDDPKEAVSVVAELPDGQYLAAECDPSDIEPGEGH